MRKIIHIDMDAFFAAVEMRDNPQLQSIPMAVGGDKDRRGVLCTANYEARKFGVRAAMPTSMAYKLCPKLVLVKPDLSKYAQVSEQIFDLFSQFTHKIEPLSLDEAYLDVTGSDHFQGSATLIAKKICQEIYSLTQLTASAGIAPNKLLAKLASDINKPNGLYTVAPHQVEEFIKNIAVERIWGVGKVTARKMHELNIKTCIDMRRYSKEELIDHFGKFGGMLFDFCRGIDEREVITEYQRKSLGLEETFPYDVNNLNEMKTHLIKIIQDLEKNMEHYPDRIIKNLYVKIKYFDFKQTIIERQKPFKVDSFLELLEMRWCQDPRAIRLLGAGIKFVSPPQNDQFELPFLT